MEEDKPSLEEVRRELIWLFEEIQCVVKSSARYSGRLWFNGRKLYFTSLAIPNHILRLLRREDVKLEPVKMGTPPGSGGLAYRVFDPLHPSLYIKVKVEEGMAVVLSFHPSKHKK